MTPDAFPCDRLNGLTLEEELSDSGLTLSWLLDILWSHCPEFRGAVGKGTVHEVSSRDISEGKGYVSNVYKTVMKLADAPSESFTVMMKVPSTACLKKFAEAMGADRAANPLANFDVISAHNVECKVYDFLRETKCLPIAKTWYTQQAKGGQVGVLFMEDLDEEGINLRHVLALTLQQASSRDICEGKGYVSSVYKTVLKLSGGPSDSFTVMMKVPSTAKLKKFGEDMGADRAANPLANFDVVSAHNVECKVYDLMREAKCLPIAKTWYTQQAKDCQVGVILMECLDEDGINLGHVSALTLQQVKNAVRDCAVFHVHLLCLDEEATKKWQAAPAEKNVHLDEFFDFIHHMIAAVPEFKEEHFKSLLAQLEPTMVKAFGRYSLLDRPKEVGLPLLLCLGDTGAHNVFFKKAPDATPSNDPNAYHDFQIALAGNQLHDIARILYMFCDAEVRREAEHTLIEDYFKTLVEHTKNNGQIVEFGTGQLNEAYALAAVYQALFTVCMCVGLVDMKNATMLRPFMTPGDRSTFSELGLQSRTPSKMLQKYAPLFLANELVHPQS